MSSDPVRTIIEKNRGGEQIGLYSVCSANELVLRFTIHHAVTHDYPLIIESTANQVNQSGGYTGLRPHEFMAWLLKIAHEEKMPVENLVTGGDHLGPILWQHESEVSAMEKALEMVRSYVLAGFRKIHLDTSMKLADDPPGPLDPGVCARRGAILAKAVYEVFSTMTDQSKRPLLVIGSEVPIPGGSREHEKTVNPTEAADFLDQVSIFKDEFRKAGLDFSDVIAFVVQAGVEFGDDFVCHYDPERAAALTGALKKVPGLVFEGHSTDYQNPEALSEMVRDGVAILKVGPALTFALREGLFLLEAVEEILTPAAYRSNLKKMLLEEMNKTRHHWEKHYSGSIEEVEYQKLYSYSDRCRYYLPEKKVRGSMELLIKNISTVPPALLSQFFPAQYRRYMAGKLDNDPLSLLCDRIWDICANYAAACGWVAATGPDIKSA